MPVLAAPGERVSSLEGRGTWSSRVRRHSPSAIGTGSTFTPAHHDAWSPERCSSRWCVRQTGTVCSSLTFRPSARGWAKKMMRVRRGASAYDARLPRDEFTMFLVAQANGVGHDAAAGGADFLRENVDAVCAFDARLCRGSDMDGFARHFLRLLVRERLQPRPEAIFDEMRIGGCQQVFVGEPPVNPARRLVRGR
jgi:hypothetical protein